MEFFKITLFRSCLYLQWFLTGNSEQEIDKVCRYEVKQQNTHHVHEIIGLYAAVWVPQAHGEGVIVEMFLSQLKRSPPRARAVLELKKEVKTYSTTCTSFILFVWRNCTGWYCRSLSLNEINMWLMIWSWILILKKDAHGVRS